MQILPLADLTYSSAAAGAMARLVTAWRSAALLLAVCAWCTPAHAYEPKGFIRVCKGRFADSSGRQWSFAGTPYCQGPTMYDLWFPGVVRPCHAPIAAWWRVNGAEHTSAWPLPRPVTSSQLMVAMQAGTVSRRC